MHGLVSLLDPEHYAQVEAIWRELETACSLTEIQVTPFPHFSWLIAEDFDWPTLEAAMQEISAQTGPFSIRTAGLALFSGPSPVVYIPITRTGELSALHAWIWERTQSIGGGLCPLYAPSSWMPHISLAYGDVTLQTLSCLMQRLAFRSFDWEITIKNFALIYEPQGKIGELKYQFQLTGG
jgi:2'-5' RNA ligase